MFGERERTRAVIGGVVICAAAVQWLAALAGDFDSRAAAELPDIPWLLTATGSATVSSGMLVTDGVTGVEYVGDWAEDERPASVGLIFVSR